MVLINEIGNFEDISAALRGTVAEPPTWPVRPEWRNRVFGAYAIERAHWLDTERLAGSARDATVRDILARICLEEEPHQAIFRSLLKPNISPWQHVVGGELAFISFISALSQIEPDKTVRAVFEYVLVDHLAHVKALVDETDKLGLGKEPAEETAKLPPGRELAAQFLPTQELISGAYRADADPATKVNIRLVIMAEVVTRELVEALSLMGAPESLVHLGRLISTVEAEHNLLLRTLLDPGETTLEQAFYGELAEVMGLNRLMMTEKESGARDAYEFVVEEDEDHLRYLGGLLADLEGKDPIALSASPAFTAKPRRTLENHLRELVKAGFNFKPDGRPAAKVA